MSDKGSLKEGAKSEEGTEKTSRQPSETSEGGALSPGSEPAQEGSAISPPTEGAVISPPTERSVISPPTEGSVISPPTEGSVISPPTEGSVISPPTEGSLISPPTEGSGTPQSPTGQSAQASAVSSDDVEKPNVPKRTDGVKQQLFDASKKFADKASGMKERAISTIRAKADGKGSSSYQAMESPVQAVYARETEEVQLKPPAKPKNVGASVAGGAASSSSEQEQLEAGVERAQPAVRPKIRPLIFLDDRQQPFEIRVIDMNSPEIEKIQQDKREPSRFETLEEAFQHYKDIEAIVKKHFVPPPHMLPPTRQIEQAPPPAQSPPPVPKRVQQRSVMLVKHDEANVDEIVSEHSSSQTRTPADPEAHMTLREYITENVNKKGSLCNLCRLAKERELSPENTSGRGCLVVTLMTIRFYVRTVFYMLLVAFPSDGEPEQAPRVEPGPEMRKANFPMSEETSVVSNRPASCLDCLQIVFCCCFKSNTVIMTWDQFYAVASQVENYGLRDGVLQRIHAESVSLRKVTLQLETFKISIVPPEYEREIDNEANVSIHPNETLRPMDVNEIKRRQVNEVNEVKGSHETLNSDEEGDCCCVPVITLFVRAVGSDGSAEIEQADV